VTENTAWESRINLNKANRGNWWDGNIFSLGKSETLLEAMQEADQEMNDEAERKAIDLTPRPEKVSTVQEIKAHFYKNIQKYNGKRIDLVRQTRYRGKIVDVHFIQTENSFWGRKGFTTRLALEEPADEGINSPIVDRLGVVIEGDDPMVGFEQAFDGLLKKIRAKDKTKDESPNTAKVGEVSKGGIDLNPTILNTEIKRNGRGVIIPVMKGPMPDVNDINGFVPNIINITPVTNLPLLLGIKKPTEEKTTDLSYKLSSLN
jgi:hypothetical protein